MDVDIDMYINIHSERNMYRYMSRNTYRYTHTYAFIDFFFMDIYMSTHVSQSGAKQDVSKPFQVQAASSIQLSRHLYVHTHIYKYIYIYIYIYIYVCVCR